MSRKRDRAIVLLSGGLDSCVTAAIAHENYDVALLHANYGQRTERRELRAFAQIADHYGVERRLIVNLEYLLKIGGSSLTDESIPVPHAGDANPERIPNTYVPFRNTHLIAVAVSWGEVTGARKVFIGAIEADSSGSPDCRRRYFEIYDHLIEAGTRPETRIEIETPLIDLTKEEIVRKGMKLKAPLHLTWSCYSNEDVACGHCESCMLRLKGFKAAGIPDPIPYI
ncbi:MAG: 7-cyano-7-deazaguanine synthase QueC [Pseudomonadota bacterium]